VPPPYRGVLFDLFGTLVRFDLSRLPELEYGGRRVPTTIVGLADLLASVAPGVGPERFLDALTAVTRELTVERACDHREHPSRERFQRALLRVGVAPAIAADGGVVLSRAHLALLAGATEYPASHRALVAQAAGSRRIAVVSNFDDTATAYEILHRHGILGSLDAVVVSDSLGVRKPHALVMRQALLGIGLPAERVLFVGDTFAEDVVGAQRVGLDVAWIDRAGAGVPDGAESPTYVVSRLEELAPVLA